MGVDTDVMPKIMQSALDRTSAFLEQEMGITIASATPSMGKIDLLALRDITAIVGVGGSVNLLLAFSFQRRLLDELTAKFTEGLTFPDEERDLYLEDAAAEVVNIIAGHCTIDLADPDVIISLSPPVIVNEAKSIRRPNKGVFACLCLETKFGFVDINFIGPREIFDERLNYVKRNLQAS